MEDLKKEQIKACKSILQMYQALMIETQAEIRKCSKKIDLNESLYETYKAHYSEYEKVLKQLEGENN